jgi:hypothetical protein
MSPSAKGRSRTAVLAINGDPAWQAAVAPILQWVRMAWKARHEDGNMVTLEDLETAWQAATKDSERLTDDAGRRRWQQVRGPAGATYLTLDRIGWRSDDGLVFVDDNGTRRRIDEFSPALWASLLKEAVQREHERQLGLKTGHKEVRNRRICVDVVKRVAKSKKTDPEGGRALVTNACNGIWSKRRASNAGYDVEDLSCQLCGQHEDTIHG